MKIIRALKLFFYFLLVLVIECVFSIVVFLVYGLFTGISFIVGHIASHRYGSYETSKAKLILVTLIILVAPINYNIKHGKQDYEKKDKVKVVGYILVSIILVFFSFYPLVK